MVSRAGAIQNRKAVPAKKDRMEKVVIGVAENAILQNNFIPTTSTLKGGEKMLSAGFLFLET